MSGVPITIPGLPAVTLAIADQLAVWDQSAGITGKASFSELQNLLDTLYAALTGATFTGTVNVARASNASSFVAAASGDYGAGSWGPFITVGANSNADGGGGIVRFTRRGGAVANVWVDAGLLLRVSTGLNGGAAGDVTGTVVGSQSSSLDTKDVLDEGVPIEEVLAAIAQGAEAVRRFLYKAVEGADEFGNPIQGPRPYGGEEFEGVIVDYAPRYGMDRDEAHPAGKTLNTITVEGDLLRAVDYLIRQNAELTMRIEALELARQEGG